MFKNSFEKLSFCQSKTRGCDTGTSPKCKFPERNAHFQKWRSPLAQHKLEASGSSRGRETERGQNVLTRLTTLGQAQGVGGYMKLGAKPYSLRDHVWGKNHINVKNTQQDFSYLGGKALRAPLYSGDRNGLSPPRAPAELEKQASRVRRWLVMRRAGGVGEGTIEVYSI